MAIFYFINWIVAAETIRGNTVIEILIHGSNSDLFENIMSIKNDEDIIEVGYRLTTFSPNSNY